MRINVELAREHLTFTSWGDYLDWWAGNQQHHRVRVLRLLGAQMRAHFQGEAWVNNQAIPTDPEGETDWTVTPEWAARVVIRDGIDNDDVLKDDPAAPEWVREHRGPFTITVS